MKKTLYDVNLKHKIVLARVDFNLPLAKNDNNQYYVTDANRIKKALKTINFITQQGAKLILLSHLGRVKTEEDLVSKSLKPVVEEFKKYVDNDVFFVPKTRGSEVEEAIKNLKSGQILFLENTRFEDLNNKAESKNDPELAKYWASLGDVFVNDAFATAHRSHASNVGIASNIKESALGFLMQEEIENLAKLKNNPARPYVAIIGGAKISDKIQVLEQLIKECDKVLIGGAMAYTFLKAQGVEIGTSLVEDDYLELAKNLYENNKTKILLPIDNAYAKEFADIQPQYSSPENKNIPADCTSMDIGPETVKLFANEIQKAKTIFWNGPLGVTEFSNYEVGTKSIAIAISQNTDCFSVVGGGDSVAAINKLNYQDRFSFISTGGGASLEYVQGKLLPGYESIEDK
ncbi:phosphoglycerate kinase [Mycoplasma sp. 128]|uniref:phosphoglycerate kinase n=1 Tax=Mycoplasma sp. 3341 TaxID=3447506 RepID=UPI003F65BB63